LRIKLTLGPRFELRQYLDRFPEWDAYRQSLVEVRSVVPA